MMVKMSDGIGKIVEGYNSVISALEKKQKLQTSKVKMSGNLHQRNM